MKLQEAKEIIKSPSFPSKFKENLSYKYKFLIGIGGNLGNTRKIFEKFIFLLKKDKRFSVIEISPILKNSAFGYTFQPDFLNAVILVKSSLYAKELLKILQHYEIIFKRKRSFKNAPRTLDLDILYFNNKTRKDEKLIIPHPGVNSRLSVIIPFGMMKEQSI